MCQHSCLVATIWQPIGCQLEDKGYKLGKQDMVYIVINYVFLMLGEAGGNQNPYNGIVEVRGSIPLGSTIIKKACHVSGRLFLMYLIILDELATPPAARPMSPLAIRILETRFQRFSCARSVFPVDRPGILPMRF